MDQIKLGKFISDVRNERGMTQDELAEKLGVSSGKVVSKWECGNTMPDFDTIIEISKVLKVTLYEISICKRIKKSALTEKAKKKFITSTDLFKENIKNKLIIIVGIVLGIIFGLSTIFTIDNYKTIKVYQLYSSLDNQKFNVEGNIIVTPKFSIFNLTNINNLEENQHYLNILASNIEYEILDSNNQRVLAYDNNNFKNNYEYNNLLQTLTSQSISVKIDSNKLPKDNNLKLKISYNDERKIHQEIIIDFEIDKIFENTF